MIDKSNLIRRDLLATSENDSIFGFVRKRLSFAVEFQHTQAGQTRGGKEDERPEDTHGDREEADADDDDHRVDRLPLRGVVRERGLAGEVQ